MPSVTMIKGLPASGKTTLAKAMMKNGHYVRVNKDDLRAMLHDGEYSPEKEYFVRVVRDAIIQLALEWNLDVIVDDTNLNPAHQEQIRAIAISNRTECKTIEMEISLEECIRRDGLREKPVGEAVIREMFEKYMADDENGRK